MEVANTIGLCGFDREPIPYPDDQPLLVSRLTSCGAASVTEMSRITTELSI